MNPASKTETSRSSIGSASVSTCTGAFCRRARQQAAPLSEAQRQNQTHFSLPYLRILAQQRHDIAHGLNLGGILLGNFTNIKLFFD